tara:strand:+ start:4523 stop:5539 length:1017 start_codon:yes stop_codon:yes gene_type:complete
MKNKLLNKKVIIIAEGCDNHFGKLSNAKKMVIEAKKAGADVIKFQHHIPDEEMLKRVPKSKNFTLSLYEFLKKYSLSIDDHKKLLVFCKKKKIEYLCTPFSYKAAKELNSIGVKWFKIGSGEFTDLPFIKKILKFNKPVIFSTGMSSIKEIEMVCRLINSQKNNKVALMNCTSEYPPRFEDINLNFITKMKKKYPKFKIGHSDHTNTITTALGAVALGARIIEKHVYLNNLNYGPDRHSSISFKDLKSLVNQIRNLELSLGDNKFVYKKELPIRKWALRSIVSIRDIQNGEILSEKNIWSKRPGTGIPSRFFDKLIGLKTKVRIKKDTLIKLSMLKKK